MARLRASVLSVALLGFAPVLGAQQPTAKPAAAKSAEAVPATHTVKRGDTLWDIAKRYLGDAYLWPEIYRLNTAIIEDPHWIYPGETLRLPAGATAIDEGPGEGGAARATDPNSMTVFNPKRYKRQSRGVRESVGLLASHQAVRPGDYLASPFVWSDDRKSTDGVVRSTAESQVVSPQIEPRVFQSDEAVFVTLPPGAPRTRGTTFLTYQLGPVLPGQGQVIIPTGVLMLEADAPPGDVRAVITKRFREVLAGQGVMMTDTLLPRRDIFPSRVEFGTATKLTWMLDRPVIAQMGGYVILDGSDKAGFNTGDQVTLRTAMGTGVAGETREPEEAAVAQVLRVTPWGVSAILLRRGAADMEIGMSGRITAKMP